MAIPSFFKQNKPRGFNYVPRYYDPAKEEMMERRRAQSAEQRTMDAEQRAKGAELRAQGTVYRSKIMRGDMKNYFHRRQERVERHTMIRILVIIIIMVLAVYLYLRF
ncbi:MAG: hypothetical protein WAV93_09430 [Bacteroidales bacterium]